VLKTAIFMSDLLKGRLPKAEEDQLSGDMAALLHP
jgi:hypothetical protein